MSLGCPIVLLLLLSVRTGLRQLRIKSHRHHPSRHLGAAVSNTCQGVKEFFVRSGVVRTKWRPVACSHSVVPIVPSRQTTGNNRHNDGLDGPDTPKWRPHNTLVTEESVWLLLLLHRMRAPSQSLELAGWLSSSSLKVAHIAECASSSARLRRRISFINREGRRRMTGSLHEALPFRLHHTRCSQYLKHKRGHRAQAAVGSL
uniref:Putative secreted protein n=1 Tax=Anopheles triannulatus TaxID=58253 RepID=A0A2M4B5E0_9DIPT